MSKPTHQEIEQRAYQLWLEEGCPDGRAQAIWLEAERSLSAADTPTAGEPVKAGGHPPSEIAAEERARHQREAARSPDAPRKGTAVRPTPADTGKPIWPQPHSS